MPLRTAVYIDGFNIYYRALKDTPYKWLDPLLLAQQLLRPENQITSIRYFTARVSSTPSDPDKHVRQDTYIRALKAHIPCLTVHEGTFLRHAVDMMPVVRTNPPGLVKVWKTEEKGSDVNLAVHLLNDAWLNAFDTAFVISNDSDLAEGIRLAARLGKAVGVASPDTNPKSRMNALLRSVATFSRRIEEKHLRNSQLPQVIPTTTITKPRSW